jgi:Ser/Thr protein kinase RdoA (MazF antagonist)
MPGVSLAIVEVATGIGRKRSDGKTSETAKVEMEKGPLIGVGRTAEVYAWGDHQILKLYRMGMPEDWVRHEARVARVVSAAGLHAPAIGGSARGETALGDIAAGDIVEVDGRLGIVYERITGPSMLDTIARRPWTLRSMARQFAAVHATMHNCARPELPRQRHGLIHAIHHAPGLDEATRQRALTALDRLPDGESVCHGDYHPDNIILSPQGAVVIDWMTAGCATRSPTWPGLCYCFASPSCPGMWA